MYAALQSYSLGSLPHVVILFLRFSIYFVFTIKVTSYFFSLFHYIMPLIQLTLSLMTVNVRCYGFPTSNLSYFPSGSLSVDVLRMFYAIFCSYPSHAIVAATPTSCMAFGALWKM